MTKQEELIGSIETTYAEWLEHAGEQRDKVMIHILASLLLKEKKETDFHLAVCRGQLARR